MPTMHQSFADSDDNRSHRDHDLQLRRGNNLTGALSPNGVNQRSATTRWTIDQPAISKGGVLASYGLHLQRAGRGSPLLKTTADGRLRLRRAGAFDERDHRHDPNSANARSTILTPWAIAICAHQRSHHLFNDVDYQANDRLNSEALRECNTTSADGKDLLLQLENRIKTSRRRRITSLTTATATGARLSLV